MSEIILDSNFESEVLNSDIPVLVDFYAVWCGPCKMLAPILEQISAKMVGKVKIVKVDIDQSPNLAQKFEIRSVPTLILFKNGEIFDKMIGVSPMDAIVDKINNAQ